MYYAETTKYRMFHGVNEEYYRWYDIATVIFESEYKYKSKCYTYIGVSNKSIKTLEFKNL